MTKQYIHNSSVPAAPLRACSRRRATAAPVLMAVVGMCAAVATLGAGVARASDPYAYDTTHFNSPHGFSWSLGGSSGNAYGRLLEREPNGNLIVASLVPPCGATDQANGLSNLGLELYGPNGQPTSWTLPGSYGCGGGNIDFPNVATANVLYIRDIKYYNEAIYVMMDVRISATDVDTHVVAFGADGHFISEKATFIANTGEFGAGLVAYPVGTTQNRLTAIATQYGTNGAPHIETANYSIAANGDLSLNTSYGASGYSTITAPQTCIQPQPCQITAARIVARKYGLLIPLNGPEIYVVGDLDHNTAAGGANDTNAVVVGVRNDGSLDTAFGNGGFAELAFNVEDQFEDHGRDIASACDGENCSGQHLWVLDEAHTHCGIGVGVAALNALGRVMTAFGSAGRSVFGGNVGAPVCGGVLADHPYAMVLDGNRLDIVGIQSRNFGSGAFSDPLVATMDAASGALGSYAFLPFINNSNGGSGPPARWGDGLLLGLVAVGDGSFVAAGQAHDDFFNVWNVAVAQFRADLIFANGFD